MKLASTIAFIDKSNTCFFLWIQPNEVSIIDMSLV